MRDQRLSVSATRIPNTLWHVVLFASVVLLGGFFVLGLRSLALSLGVVAAVTGTIVFLISVIKDIDNPFRGVWNVTYARRSRSPPLGLSGCEQQAEITDSNRAAAKRVFEATMPMDKIDIAAIEAARPIEKPNGVTHTSPGLRRSAVLRRYPGLASFNPPQP